MKVSTDKNLNNMLNDYVMSEKIGGGGYKFNRVLFIGSKESGLKVLKKIYDLSKELLVGCVTVNDAEDVRSELNGFRSFCEKSNIDLDILSGKCDLTDSVEKFKPDICVVMGWYYIISEELLDRLPGGFIGIHNSLLPSHRGFAPVVWSMIAGETETGFSVFSFDRGMDTGDIWYQKKVSVDERDYISDVLDKINNEIDIFFESSFLDVLKGKLKPHKQCNTNVSYGARRTAADGKIDWNKPAQEIYNFIRAQSRPYPGAYAFYNGQEVRIWRAEVFQHKIQGSSGQVGIVDSDEGIVVIVCGNDTGLLLREIELSGEKMPILNIIKGINRKME